MSQLSGILSYLHAASAKYHKDCHIKLILKSERNIRYATRS